MKTADAIIGANFGDEGKGLMTDYHAAPFGDDALVVRHNGGAQAGHTVTTPEGMRHVFSHIGSGAFSGAATLLSRFFACNPLLFRKEHDALSAFRITPAVLVDAHAPVTTPYDMMINQIAEDSRGLSRHGSCGVGFGETVERHSLSPYPVSYADLADTAALQQKLANIRTHWVPQRLEKLGIKSLSEKWQERLSSRGIVEKFLDDAAFFLQATEGASSDLLETTRKHIVFEGAQGLLLDQDRGWFPHVTRSNTGLRNILVLAHEAGIDRLKTVYVTRAYGTRHGAGPLPHELPEPPARKIEDKTNVTNNYQGALRFGLLDAELLTRTIHDDAGDAAAQKSIALTWGIAITCLDQMDDKTTVVMDDRKQDIATKTLPLALRQATGASFVLTSRGPSRKTVMTEE